MEVYVSRCVQPTLSAPSVDRPERRRKRFAVTSWSSGMHDPAVRRVLDEVRVEWHQQLGKSECVPAAAYVDADVDLGLDAMFTDRGRC
jgi:hypothetical protein